MGTQCQKLHFIALRFTRTIAEPILSILRPRESRRKLAFRIQDALLNSPCFALKSDALLLIVATLVMIGVSLDTTQAVYLYYANHAFFVSLEKNPVAIYFLRSGYWYALTAWDGLLGALAILTTRSKRLFIRFLGLAIALGLIIAPSTWWFGYASLAVFYAILCVFLVAVILKAQNVANTTEKPCLIEILKILVTLSV